MRAAARVGLLLTLLAIPRAAVAQHAVDSVNDGPWHTATRLRDTLLAGDPGDAVVLRAASAELAIGRADRARALLGKYPIAGGDLYGAAQRLEAEIAYALGDYTSAANRFVALADAATGRDRGVLAARAAASFERAGRKAEARAFYLLAADRLPAIARWLDWRRARVAADPGAALALLDSVPPVGATLVATSRPDVLLRLGDVAAAITGFEAAGKLARAGDAALTISDSAAARQLYYRALAGADTAEVSRALRPVLAAFPPKGAADLLTVAKASRGRDNVQAEHLARRAVRAGDTSVATLLVWAGTLLDIHDSATALRVLTRAANAGGPDAAGATFTRARLLVRRSTATVARAALLNFAARYPADPQAAQAVYLAADLRGTTAPDSLLAAVVRRWPADFWASEARFRLAASELQRHDTAGAIARYRDEVAAGGARVTAARLAVARLREATGDSAGARGELLALARDDSLGYYGAAAREAAGLPDLDIATPRDREPVRWVAASMAQLDLLDATSLDDEAQTLVAYLMTRPDVPAPELLDLGEALIQRGRVTQGIALGWRAARTLSMNNTRVLHVIYPWPSRDLIAGEADKFGLDPYLLAGLIRQESNFEPAVISHAGATGMMQLMPGTARFMARQLGVQWSAPLVTVADANVHLGAAHLAGLLHGYDGDVAPAVAAYNAGGRPVNRWMRGRSGFDAYLFIERIPYAETRAYVHSVLRNQALYRALYPPPSPG